MTHACIYIHYRHICTYCNTCTHEHTHTWSIGILGGNPAKSLLAALHKWPISSISWSSSLYLDTYTSDEYSQPLVPHIHINDAFKIYSTQKDILIISIYFNMEAYTCFIYNFEKHLYGLVVVSIYYISMNFENKYSFINSTIVTMQI